MSCRRTQSILDRFALSGGRRISRRTVLSGLWGGARIAIALPVLECMQDRKALARGITIPKRFGVFYWGNGVVQDTWEPEQTGPDWTPTTQMRHLTDHTDVVSVVSGTEIKMPNTVVHWSGAVGILSGYPLITSSEEESTFSGPSIDQLIAQHIGTDSLFPSVQTAATDVAGMSFNGTYSRNPPMTKPIDFYERLFGSTFVMPGEAPAEAGSHLLRRSALDTVMDQLLTLNTRVGASDRMRLEQHFEGVRQLEHRLAILSEGIPPRESCTVPDAPEEDYRDDGARPQIALRSRAMVDMLAMALACDQTRVFGHYLSDPIDDLLFPSEDIGHHELTHQEGMPQNRVQAIVAQCIKEYAYLVKTFREIPEGDGSLLDSCAILGCSEIADGHSHSLTGIPILIAGSAGGSLVSGSHIHASNNENTSQVLLALAQAMDVDIDELGAQEGWTDIGLRALMQS